MCIEDKTVGHYTVAGTTRAGRADLFKMNCADAHHIGTLISGSRTNLERFEADCHAIVEALAAREVKA